MFSNLYKHFIIFIIVSLLSFTGVSSLYSTTIYTWTDENGQMHITDYPPPVKRSERKTKSLLKLKSAPPEESKETEDISVEEKIVKKESPHKKGELKADTTPAAVLTTPVKLPVTQQTPLATDVKSQPSVASTPATTVKPAGTKAALKTSPIVKQPVQQKQAAPIKPKAPPKYAPKPVKPGQGMIQSQDMKTRVFALLGAMGMLIFISLGLVLLIYLLCAYCLFRIAKKLNLSKPWVAWIPVANTFTYVSAGNRPRWFALVILLAPVADIVTMGIGSLASLIFSIIVAMHICKNLGVNKWLGLLFIVPLINFLLLVYLAYKKDSDTSMMLHDAVKTDSSYASDDDSMSDEPIDKVSDKTEMQDSSEEVELSLSEEQDKDEQLSETELSDKPFNMMDIEDADTPLRATDEIDLSTEFGDYEEGLNTEGDEEREIKLDDNASENDSSVMMTESLDIIDDMQVTDGESLEIKPRQDNTDSFDEIISEAGDEKQDEMEIQLSTDDDSTDIGMDEQRSLDFDSTDIESEDAEEQVDMNKEEESLEDEKGVSIDLDMEEEPHSNELKLTKDEVSPHMLEKQAEEEEISLDIGDDEDSAIMGEIELETVAEEKSEKTVQDLKIDDLPSDKPPEEDISLEMGEMEISEEAEALDLPESLDLEEEKSDKIEEIELDLIMDDEPSDKLPEEEAEDEISLEMGEMEISEEAEALDLPESISRW